MTLSSTAKLLSAAVGVSAVLILGGCTSVPAVTYPGSPTPGTPQKTITELQTDILDRARTAVETSGVPDGWFLDPGAHVAKIPWNPDGTGFDSYVSVDSCTDDDAATDWYRLRAEVTHEPVGDPHPLADHVTKQWEEMGYRIERTIDFKNGDYTVVQLAAHRTGGASFRLFASTEIISIDFSTPCSNDPSIWAWMTRDWPPVETSTPKPGRAAQPNTSAPPSASVYQQPEGESARIFDDNPYFGF